LAVSSAAFGQIDVIEPVTGNFEYIGAGNIGDTAFVYVIIGGAGLGVPVATGIDVTFTDGAGTPVGGVTNITGAFLTQVAGGGDGDGNMENGETWRFDVASALGANTPIGGVLMRLQLTGAPASLTVQNADGLAAGGTDAIDKSIQIITADSFPTSANFDGTGAAAQMYVTFSTPTVGFVAPNTATIPFWGNQNINGLGVASANSPAVGGGAATDWEFTDGNDFNSNTGLAGTTDITVGSYAQAAGNTLQWNFDTTGSSLESGTPFRATAAPAGTPVRDSAGSVITTAALAATQLQPLAVTSVAVLSDTQTYGSGVLEVTYNRPLNPGAVGNVSFYRDANGGNNSIRNIVNGTPTNVNGLDCTAVAFDPATPNKVRLSITNAASFNNNIAPDALSTGSQGDTATGTFQQTFDAAVGVVPQASFGASPAFAAAQNASLTLLDQRAPQIVTSRTRDTFANGVLDGVDLQFDEPVTVSGNTGFELSLVGGIDTFPIDQVNLVTGELPAATATVASATLANNIIPIAAGAFSVPATGSGVSLVSFDADGDGFTTEPIDTNNTIRFTYDILAHASNTSLSTQSVGAVNLFINTTSVATVNGLTNTNVAAGAGVIKDAAGNVFTNDTAIADTTAPFATPTPVIYTAAEAQDGAAPFAVRLSLQPGDNSPVAGGNITSDAQLLFEQDGVVADQKTNDLVRIITGEALSGGMNFNNVTANLLSYGNAGDNFGNSAFNVFLNNNGAFNPQFPNVAVFTPVNATNAAGVVPGVNFTLTADTPGRGVRDAANNQTAFINKTLDNTAAPYIAHILDANGIVQAGVFLTPDTTGDFVAGISGRATQPIDAATLRAQDFIINFGGTITAVAVDSADENKINWTVGGTQIGIKNTVTFTYTGGAPGAFLVASQAPPDGTGVAVSAINAAALNGAGNNAVLKLQDPWQDATDVAVLPVVANILGLDGLPVPINSKIFAFNALPIVRQISADHNNIPFIYSTDDHNYNNDTPTGNNPILFSHVYPSLNAFTNWLQGIRTDVYLHRQANNAQIFTNTKTNPFNQQNFFGDTKSDNSTLVDSIRMQINGTRLTSITFTGTGEQSTDRVRSGRLDLAWDVYRSFNGTLDNYYRFGYFWGQQPVYAGVGVVDNALGRAAFAVSRPVSQFGATSRFNSIAKPLIFVVELPDGQRFAVSSVLLASNTNDHDGDNAVGDPILFEAQVLRSNNSDGSARDGLTLNFDLRRVGSHIVYPEWNLVPIDRASGVVAGSNSNLPALPAGVTTANIVSYNTAQFPFASPLSASVFWAEAGAGFNGLGNPLIGAYDGKWTAADDFTGPFSTIGLDENLVTNFVFTLTTRGVQLGNGITSAVGGYGVAFYNNANLSGGNNLNNFGVFQFGTQLAQTSVFASNPINSGNSRSGNGWILGTVTNPFDPASGFFSANAGSDYFIAFNNLGRNPATGNFTVLIDVGALDSTVNANNPNNIRRIGVGGSQAAFFHYDN